MEEVAIVALDDEEAEVLLELECRAENGGEARECLIQGTAGMAGMGAVVMGMEMEMEMGMVPEEGEDIEKHCIVLHAWSNRVQAEMARDV